MKKFSRLVLPALFALSTASPVAFAAPSAFEGGGWTEFSFGDAGSHVGLFDATCFSGSCEVRITDAFLSGDRFSLVGGGAPPVTSVPGSTGDQIGSDYDGAFADARWSSASWTIGAGTSFFDVFVVLSPFQGGGGAFQVLAAVPEPETYAMMLAGLGLLGFAARRRKQQQTA